MPVGWSALTFEPDDEAVAALRSAWAWLLPARFKPLLFSTLGDMFFASESGEVFWLNTATAEVTVVATAEGEFRELLGTDLADEWFLPPLVEKLHNAGKIPGPGCCYTFATLPIFAEGRYEVENLNPVPAKEHFRITADIHRQIRSLPDGAKVRINVVP